ncbi:hypothetical protein HYR99_32645 [Candidatus Poribacteria bacterium]|nr:hypothetical protein [Candidatus Poribacteria bacterium]
MILRQRENRKTRKRENEKARQFYASRFTFYVSRFTFHAWLSGFLALWLCAIATPRLLNAHPNDPPSERKHPTLDEILGDDSSLKPLERLDATPVSNPFFQVDAFVAKLGIFVLLLFIIYGIIVIGFNTALEKDKPPLPAFFRFNAIFILSMLVLGFLCFSEYTYRGENVTVTGIVDHFRNVNWLFWGVLTALVVILLVVSQRHLLNRGTGEE